MKRKILLLTILCGFIILEWGCDDGQGGGSGGGSTKMEIDSISESLSLKVDRFCYVVELSPDSVKYDEYLIRVQFVSKYVMNIEKSRSDYSAYAYPAPNWANWELDSLKIINCQTEDSLNVTSKFELSYDQNCRNGDGIGNDDSFRESMRNLNIYGPLEFDFYLADPPEIIKESKYRILFYTENGGILEAITKSVVVLP